MVLSMNPQNLVICGNVFQLCQGTVHLHNLCQFSYTDNYLYQENNFKEIKDNLHVLIKIAHKIKIKATNSLILKTYQTSFLLPSVVNH